MAEWRNEHKRMYPITGLIRVYGTRERSSYCLFSFVYDNICIKMRNQPLSKRIKCMFVALFYFFFYNGVYSE